MPDFDAFSPDEWKLVRRAPLLVFYYVAKADGQVDSEEVEKLIDLLRSPEKYQSAIFTEATQNLMSDASALASTVKGILSETGLNVARQFATIQQAIDERLSLEDAVAFKEALVKLGVDVAVSKGDDSDDIPLSKEEWTEVASFKKMLKLT